MTGPAFEAAARALSGAPRVAVLTGAGISAESGLPTFRGAQGGLWSRFRPEELATPEAFAADPPLVWAWYQWRRALVARARPNPAHVALVELERRASHFTLITQNVDGLHRAAGSRHIIELHGELMADRCSGCGRVRPCEVEPALADAPVVRLAPPACEACGALLRPNVVWFGEPLPAGALERAAAAAADCTVFLVVGTSGVVYPAAALVPLAAGPGKTVVVVDPEVPVLRHDLHLAGGAGAILPLLVAAARVAGKPLKRE